MMQMAKFKPDVLVQGHQSHLRSKVAYFDN